MSLVNCLNKIKGFNKSEADLIQRTSDNYKNQGLSQEEADFKAVRDYVLILNKEMNNLKNKFEIKTNDILIEDVEFKKKNDKIIIEDKYGNGAIVDPKVLKAFGYRIPTQGYNSMSSLEVVGLLPEGQEATIVAPREFVPQMGSDFDVDKLNIFTYDTKDNSVIESRDNEILDIELDIMSKKSIYNLMTEPLTSDEIKKHIPNQKIRGISRIYDGYFNEKYNESRDGATGIGTFATLGTFLSLTSTIKQDIQFENIDRLSFIDAKPNNINDPYTRSGKRLKLQVVSQFLSASLDNEKDPILGKINANTQTFGVIQTMIALGYTESDVIKFINQPIIKQYINNIQSIIDEKDFGIEGINMRAYVRTIGEEAQKLSEEEQEKMGNPVALNKLAADNDTLTKVNHLLQFMQFQEAGKELKSVKSIISTDSSFAPKGLIASFDREQDINYLQESSIKNVHLILGEYGKDNQNLPQLTNPTTIAGFASYYGINKANEVWNELNYPYAYLRDNVFKEISDITERVLNDEDKRFILKEIKNFAYSRAIAPLLGNKTLSEKRAELLLGEDNTLAHRIEKAQAKYPDNLFLNSLFVEKYKNEPSLVKFNNAAQEGINEDYLYDSFNALLSNNETLPLAQDLILYSLMTNSNIHPTGLSKFIPVEYLEVSGISKGLTLNLRDKSVLGGFFTQFIKNNPKYAKRIDPERTRFADNKRGFYNKDDNTPFKSFYDRPAKKWRLYVRANEQGLHVEVNILGKGIIKEYDPSMEEFDSLYPNNNINTKAVKPTTESPDKGTKKPVYNADKVDPYITRYDITSFNGLLNSMRRYATPTQNSIIQMLSKTGIKQPQLIVGELKGARGDYDADTHTITLNKDLSENSFISTAIHEGLHSVTSRIVNQYVDDASKLTDVQKKYVEQLKGIQTNYFKQVLEENKEYVESYNRKLYNLNNNRDKYYDDPFNNIERSMYDVHNIKEFITSVFTNDEVQQELNKKTFQGDKTLLQRLVEVLKNFLESFKVGTASVNEGTELEAAIKATFGIIESQAISSNTEKLQGFVNHSGGAVGSDAIWEEIGKKYGVISNHYFVKGNKTPNGNVEITQEEAYEADEKLMIANRTLKRKFPTDNEYVNNLLRRNWQQVKNANTIYAISTISNNKVNGGTGWAVQMAIDEGKQVYVFDQDKNQWFEWVINKNLLGEDSDGNFIKIITPVLTKSFAGIGTRKINDNGRKAITSVYNKSVSQSELDPNAINLRDIEGFDKIRDLSPITIEEREIIQDVIGRENAERNLPKTFENYSDAVEELINLNLELQGRNISAVLDTTDKGYVVLLKENTAGRLDYSPKTNSKTANFVNKLRSDLRFLERNISEEKDSNIKNRFRKDAEELRNQIDRLIEEKGALEEIGNVGEEQLEHMRSLLSRGELSAEELRQSIKTLSLWSTIRDSVLDPERIKDQEYRESAAIKRLLVIAGQANEMIQNDWISLSREYIKKVGEDVGIKLTLEELYAPEIDVSPIQREFRDISTSGSPLMSILDKVMRNAIEEGEKESVDQFKEIDERFRQFKGTKFFKNHGFDKFLQKKNGKYTGNFINRTKQEYFDEVKRLRNKIDVLIEKGADKKKVKKAWENFHDFIKENNIIINVNNLFIEDEEGNVKFNENKSYILSLEKALGEERTKDAIEQTKEKMKIYEKDLKAYIEQINSTENEISITELLDRWKEENSPFTYTSGQPIRQIGGEFINRKGYRYTANIPIKIWHDEDFDFINEYTEIVDGKEVHVAKEMYRWYMDKITSFYKLAPESIFQELQYNYLPNIPMSFIEEISDRGVFTAGSGIMDRMKQVLRERGIDNYSVDIDRVSGRPEYNLEYPFKDKKYTSEDVKQFNIDSSIKDIQKIMKIVAKSSIEYKHKKNIEDVVRLGQAVFDEQKEIGKKRNNTQYDENGDEANPKGLVNKKAQLDHSIIANVYGVNPEGSTNVRTKSRFLTRQEKKQQAALEQQLEKAETEEEKLKIKAEIERLGGELSLRRGVRFLLNYVQYKGMGWNSLSAIANLNFAWISNYIHAAGEEDFTRKEFRQATIKMLNTTKNILPGIGIGATIGTFVAPGFGTLVGAGLGGLLTGDKSNNNEAKKINNLMKAFNALGDIIDVNDFKKDYSSGERNWYDRFAPFELQRKSEYFSYGTTLVAMMINTKVKTEKKGEMSLYDIYDEKGNIKKELGSVEGWTDSNKGYIFFKNKYDQTAKIIHGNYDKKSPTKIKQTVGGQALMQFRSWLPEGMAARWDDQKYDFNLYRYRSGRYRMYGFSKDGIENVKRTLRRIIFLDRNKIYDDMMDHEMANLRKNVAEIQIVLSMVGLGLAIKYAIDDDDEERYITNFALNTLFRTQDDLMFYASPWSAEQMSRSAIPALKVLTDTKRALEYSTRVLFGSDIDDATYEAMWNNNIRLVPGGSGISNVIKAQDQLFNRGGR